MTSVDEPRATLTCSRCGAAIDICAFCENEACRVLLCYRCVRIALAQEIAQPHAHGG